MKQTIFFDMDGTLLQMGESAFEKEYLKRMVLFFEQRFPKKGKDIVKAVGYSAECMKQNDGTRTNEAIFWEAFEKVSGTKRVDMEPLFLQYYATDYAHIGDTYVPNADMKQLVEILSQKGYTLAVATNPLVPQVANRERVHWAGLAEIPWKEITSFEAYSSAKPHLAFYEQLCRRLQVDPKDCTMVGNSVTDDGVVQELGMEFYLLLGENSEEEAAAYRGSKGTRKELLELVKTLPDLSKQ